MTTRDLIKRFPDHNIAVVGDLMMDEYVWGQVVRVSPESPVLVVDVERETCVPGGAANVAANLMALGARVRVFGAVGDDLEAMELRRSLMERGADTTGVVTDPTRRTTRKTRVVAQNQQVLRIDREETHPLPTEASKALTDAVFAALSKTSTVLVSDYDKGVVNPLTVPAIIKRCREQGIPFVANAKPGSVGLMAGGSIVSLNVAEAHAASGDKRFRRADEINEAGAALRESMDVDALVITRGPDGLTVWERSGKRTHAPAHAVEVYDVAGAGDTVIAVLALAVAAGAKIAQAAKLAVGAAAVVVGKVGVATATVEELLEHLDE